MSSDYRAVHYSRKGGEFKSYFSFHFLSGYLGVEHMALDNTKECVHQSLPAGCEDVYFHVSQFILTEGCSHSVKATLNSVQNV